MSHKFTILFVLGLFLIGCFLFSSPAFKLTSPNVKNLQDPDEGYKFIVIGDYGWQQRPG